MSDTNIFPNINEKIILSSLFILTALAVFFAYQDTPDTYEISIYTAVPVAFWICFAVATVIGILEYLSKQQSSKLFALCIGLNIFMIVAMPLIRGYLFYGRGDSMTHLGYLHDLNAGLIQFTDLKYTVLQSLSLTIFKIFGTPIEYSLLFAIYPFVLVFFIFIPLSVRRILPHKMSIRYGLISAFLLLPIAQVGTGYLIPQPSAQSALFIVLPLYAGTVAVIIRESRWSIVALISITSVINLHPMRGVNTLIFFTGAIVLYLFITISKPAKKVDQISSRILSLTTYGLLIGLIFYALFFEAVSRFMSVYIVTAIKFLQSGTFAGSSRSEQISGALSGLNISYMELFLKMYIPQFLFCLLSLYLFLTFIKQYNPFNLNMTLIYMGGFLSTSIFFVLSLPIRLTPLRQVIIIFSVVTTIGAAVLVHIVYYQLESIMSKRQRYLPALIFIILLLLSIPIFHGSPFIYQANPQVPEQEMEGFSTIAEYQNPEIYFSDIGSTTQRFKHANFGVVESTSRNMSGDSMGIPTYSRVPDHFANHSLTTEYPSGQYIPVSKHDRLRHLEAIEGFRFTQEDFEYIDRSRHTMKIYETEGYTVYFVYPRDR